jgi:hypothetical protein
VTTTTAPSTFSSELKWFTCIMRRLFRIAAGTVLFPGSSRCLGYGEDFFLPDTSQFIIMRVLTSHHYLPLPFQSIGLNNLFLSPITGHYNLEIFYLSVYFNVCSRIPPMRISHWSLKTKFVADVTLLSKLRVDSYRCCTFHGLESLAFSDSELNLWNYESF